MRFCAVCCLLVRLILPADTAAAAPVDSSGFVTRVLDLANAQRMSAGLAPLKPNRQLQGAAQSYSEVLASSGCFAHTCGPVPDFADRDRQAGYSGWTSLGENIASGYSTPEAVVTGWMASPEHRANILSSDYSELGVGVTPGGGQFGVCWTLEFGSRNGDGAHG
jgi:uncharacterized protein YkwD